MNYGVYFDEVMGHRYFFEGDTTFQGVTYQVLRSYFVESLSPDGHYRPPFAVDTSYSYICAFMREDVEKQQVFWYSPIHEQEDPLYDFSLQEGDLFYYDILEVIQVDLITLLNGEERKRIHFRGGGWNKVFQIIEGIGNIYGPDFMEYDFEDHIVFLECFVENNETLYMTGHPVPNCYPVLSTGENAVPEKMRIYPNPVKLDGQLTLACSEPLKELAIYDLKGTLVQAIETADSGFQQDRRITLDAGKLTAGIYILKIQTTKNKMFHEKIVLY